MESTVQKDPEIVQQIRGLTERHREIQDEPLHLAVLYRPERDREDLFLFELLGNFGGNEINPEEDLFEASFESSQGVRLEPGQKLHLVLTNPEEFRLALKNHWQLARELRRSIKRGEFQVLFEDAVGREALGLLDE